MLLWAIREFSAAEIPQLSSAANILEQLMSGLERWFQNYALGELNDGVKVFYQGLAPATQVLLLDSSTCQQTPWTSSSSLTRGLCYKNFFTRPSLRLLLIHARKSD